MPDTLEDVYSICQQRGLTHLIYCGVHTQVCLLGKPMGLRNLKAAGLSCILARDLTDAHPGYDPGPRFHARPQHGQVVEHFERYLAPSVNMADELTRLGRWNPPWVVDPVRITPWGTPQRPHLFEKMSSSPCPRPGAGSRRSTTRSTARHRRRSRRATRSPFTCSPIRRGHGPRHSTGAGPVGKPSRPLRQAPARRPRPTSHLSDLTPVRAGRVTLTAISRGSPPHSTRRRRTGPTRGSPSAPRRGLRRGWASTPLQLIYDLIARYERFVALAGVDEQSSGVQRLERGHAIPSVVFKVFVDGREAAASPVMRIAEQPWRFDVPSRGAQADQPGRHRRGGRQPRGPGQLGRRRLRHGAIGASRRPLTHCGAYEPCLCDASTARSSGPPLHSLRTNDDGRVDGNHC